MTPDNIVEFKNKHIIIPLDIKKAGEGIPHNGLKQTLYRYINNAKQGKYFRDSSGTPLKLHHTEGTAFLECCKDYDGIGLQPDITFISRTTDKPDTVIEVIDSNIPSVDKILAYIKEDINVIIVRTSEVTYDEGCKHTCQAEIIFKTDSIDEKIKKAFYICFKIDTGRHGSLCIGHNENNDEYFLGSVMENPEGVTIDYHVASRPTYHNGKVSTKKNEKVNKLAEEFVKNTNKRAQTSTLNNGVMCKQLFKLQVLKKPNNNFIFCKILDKKCIGAFGKCLVGECLAVICHNGTDALTGETVYFNLNPYDHSSDPRWRNFWSRERLSEQQFNEPIKKRNVHYWKLDLCF